MNKKMLMHVLGLAMMTEAGGMGGSGSESRRSGKGIRVEIIDRRHDVAIVEKLQDLQYLEYALFRFARQMDDWNSKPVKKSKAFNVQGFEILGNTQKSAAKRLRWFLAASGLHPNTTFTEVESKLTTLRKKSEKNEEGKS